MDKILTTGDTYKFESGDKLLAEAMRTIRNRINDIVEWINAKDNNQGGNTDSPGSGDDPTQDPTTDPEQPKKSISIKLLSESSNDAVIKIDIKNAAGSQISLAEYISSDSLSYEGYTKRTVGSNDSSYSETVSKKDSAYKIVGVIYDEANTISNIIDIKAKTLDDSSQEDNSPTITEYHAYERPDDTVTISVRTKYAKGKCLSLVEINKQTNAVSLVPGASTFNMITDEGSTTGWTIEKRSDDFYVKIILHEANDINNPIYSSGEILIKAKTASEEGDNPTVDNPSRAYVASAMARTWQDPEEEEVVVTGAVLVLPEGSKLTASVDTKIKGTYSWMVDAYKTHVQNQVTPIGYVGAAVMSGGTNLGSYSIGVNLYDWMTGKTKEMAEHPERLLGSKYVLETRVRVDNANYGICHFMCDLEADQEYAPEANMWVNKWLTNADDTVNYMVVESVPTLYQIFSDPDKYSGTFQKFTNYCIGQYDTWYSKSSGNVGGTYFGTNCAEEINDGNAIQELQWEYVEGGDGLLTQKPVRKGHSVPQSVVNKITAQNATYSGGETTPIIEYCLAGHSEVSYGDQYVINNGLLMRNTIYYGGTRCLKLDAPNYENTGDPQKLSVLELKLKVTNTEGSLVKDRFDQTYYHPVVARKDKFIPLIFGIIRGGDLITGTGNNCGIDEKIIEKALLNDYDPRVRYIWQLYNMFKFKQFIYNIATNVEASQLYTSWETSSIGENNQPHSEPDTVILDPGCDYQIRAKRRAELSGKQYNVMAPVPVIDVLLDYLVELSLYFLGPKMPWEGNTASLKTSDGYKSWAVNVLPGETMLDIYWYSRLSGNDADMAQRFENVMANKLEYHKQIATTYAYSVKTKDGKFIYGKDENGNPKINTDKNGLPLTTTSFDDYVDYLAGGSWRRGTFYDDIEFLGPNWSLEKDKRSEIKLIVHSMNKSDIRNSVRDNLMNFFQTSSRNKQITPNGVQADNDSVLYMYAKKNNFANISPNYWLQIIDKNRVSYGQNNVHSETTQWTIEKFNYFIYYKPVGETQYRVVYTCYKDNEPVYFVFVHPTDNGECTFTKGNMTREWASNIKRAANTIFEDSVDSNDITILDKELFKQNGIFWIREFHLGNLDCGFKEYFAWEGDGTSYRAPFDYNVFGHQIEHGWTDASCLPELCDMVNYNNGDVISSGSAEWPYTYPDYSTYTGAVWATGMTYAQYMERAHAVQILRLCYDVDGSFRPVEKEYGFIIDGKTVSRWDAHTDEVPNWSGTSSADEVSIGTLHGRTMHLGSDNPAAQWSTWNAGYPISQAAENLIKNLGNVSITTQSAQIPTFAAITERWRRKCEELSVMYYDLHPSVLISGSITDRYNFWDRDLYDDAYSWYTATLRSSIGDKNLYEIVNGEIKATTEMDGAFMSHNGDYWPRLSKMYAAREDDTTSWIDTYYSMSTEGPCNEGLGTFVPYPGTEMYGDGIRIEDSSGMTLRDGDTFVILREQSSAGINSNAVADVWFAQPGPGGFFGNNGHVAFSSGLDIFETDAANLSYAKVVEGYGDPSKQKMVYRKENVKVDDQELIKNTFMGGYYGRYGGKYTAGAFVFKNNTGDGVPLMTLYLVRLNTLYTYGSSYQYVPKGISLSQYNQQIGEYRGYPVSAVSCTFSIDA